MPDPVQSTALTPFQQRSLELREGIGAGESVALVPRTFAEAQSFADAIARSTLVPQALRDNAPNVMMMILAGAEIGIPPVASFRVFHVIEGVPKLSADGIAAICQRSHLCEFIEPRAQSTTSVTWAAKREGRKEVTLTLTREDMIQAGLYDRKNRDGGPGNHQKYPRQMLNARCKAELCRMVWPEICAGMLSAEEQRDIDAIDVDYVEHKPVSFAPLPKIDTTRLEAPTVPRNASPAGPEHGIPAADAAAMTVDIDEDRKQRAAVRDPMPTQGGGSAAGEVGDREAAKRFADGEPITKTEAKPAALTDDDVALLAEQIKKAPDGKARAAIAADVSKMIMNEAQRKYLLGVYQKAGGRS